MNHKQAALSLGVSTEFGYSVKDAIAMLQEASKRGVRYTNITLINHTGGNNAVVETRIGVGPSGNATHFARL